MGDQPLTRAQQRARRARLQSLAQSIGLALIAVGVVVLVAFALGSGGG